MMIRVENTQINGKNDLEAFLVTSPYNLRYLTNFAGTTGLAVITLTNAYFVTDFRYEQAAMQAKGYTIVKNTGPIFEEVAKICTQDELKNLAFEESFVTVRDYDQLEDQSTKLL